MESVEINEQLKQCGLIFITFENSNLLGKLILHCSICELKFYEFETYKNHLIEHYTESKLENTSGQQEDVSTKDAIVEFLETTNGFTDLLQMERKKELQMLDYFVIDEFDGGTRANNIEEVLQEHSKFNDCFEKLSAFSLKKCAHCQRKFQLSSSLQQHLKMRLEHGNCFSGNYKCNSCNVMFQLKSSLNLHKTSSEHKQNIQRSQQQQTAAAAKVKLKSTPAKRKNPICLTGKNCISKPTETPSSNDQKLATNGATLAEEQFHCEKCGKHFNGQSRYNAHMNRHKPCEFQCTICSKAFKTVVELQTHTRFHTGERPYLCSCCGDTFATVSKLINHTRRHHTFQRTKECPVCKKKFYGSSELKMHLQSTHSSERPYKCELCASTFNRQFSLRMHMKSHENKREHKCNLCTASFNQKCNLNAHKRKAHCLLTDDDKRE